MDQPFVLRNRLRAFMAFPQHLPAEKANLALRLIPPNGPWVSFDLELDPEKDPELNVIKGPLDVSENWHGNSISELD